MRILGIDPGTMSFDLCLLDENEITFEDSISSTLVAEKPEDFAEKCLDLNLDVMIAPSGMGLNNRKLEELTEREMYELLITREGEEVPVLLGMKKFLSIVREAGLEIFFLPGIIQLPTVPRWRKYNKIDMGTADKMCIGAISVETVSRKKETGYSGVNHLVVELGGGYNSLITIEGGKIINGIGGTNFPGPGFMNAGAMDGEVAYLLNGFEKALLFEGGVGYLVDNGSLKIENFTREAYPDAFDTFVEGILFAVCSQKAITPTNEVYLSGRLTRYDNIYLPVKSRLEELDYMVEPLPRLSPKTKEAAQGYAIVGNGVYGGVYEPLVKHMEIDKSEGSILDYVYWKERL
jgi:predicted butyrate kinase (DUF1464 family)